MSVLARLLLVFGLFVFTTSAFAADTPLSISAIKLTTDAAGQQEYSVSLQILLIMTALGFIPAFVMLMTCFTRIIIVFFDSAASPWFATNSFQPDFSGPYDFPNAVYYGACI